MNDDELYTKIAPAYEGWPKWQALADFKQARGGDFSKLPGPYGDQYRVSLSPEQRIDQGIESSFQKLQIEANQRFKEFNERNPFRYDDVLAQKTTEAKEQIDPFYNESLSDYLLGVSRKRERSASDTRDLIGELQASTQSYSEQTQLRLTEAMNRAREGFADVGLFESGRRFREAEGLPTVETGRTLEDFGRRQTLRTKTAETGLERTLEELALGQKMDVRNLERERFTQTGTLARQLTGEAGQQYVQGFQQTLPPELQANQNFDLLKQIGVYS